MKSLQKTVIIYVMNVLEEKIKLLPTNPGVYVMQDDKGEIIYVGKAKNLKNRVRQYFFNGVKTNKVLAMTKNIADFYYIITKTEVDALSLENNLTTKLLFLSQNNRNEIEVFSAACFHCFSITNGVLIILH